MQATSIAAYREITPTLSERQQKVFECVKSFGRPCCDYEIAQRLGWPINSVTPRRGELLDAQKIEFAKQDKSPTGHKAVFWKIKGFKETLF